MKKKRKLIRQLTSGRVDHELEVRGIDPHWPAFAQVRRRGSREYMAADDVKQAVLYAFKCGSAFEKKGCFEREDAIEENLARMDAQDLADVAADLLVRFERQPYAMFLLVWFGGEKGLQLAASFSVRDPYWRRTLIDAVVARNSFEFAEQILFLPRIGAGPGGMFSDYVRRLGNDPLPPLSVPDVFGGSDGIVLPAGEEPMILKVQGDTLQLQRGKQMWDTMPRRLGIPAEQISAIQSAEEVLCAFLEEVRQQTFDVLFRSFSEENLIEAQHIEQIAASPLVGQILNGILLEADGELFTLEDGNPVTFDDQPFSLSGPVRVASAFRCGTETMAAWKKRFERRGICGFSLQLCEPMYDAVEPDRYENNSFWKRELPTRQMQQFLSDQLKSRSARKHGPDFSFKHVAGELYYMGRVQVSFISRKVNLILFLLDQLTAKQRIERGGFVSEAVFGTFSLEKLDHHLIISQNAKNTSMTALILDVMRRKQGATAVQEFSL